MTKIVTSLLPTDVDQGLELARRAQRAGTDMVEFRLDHFRDADAVTALVRQSAAPVLASCRVEEEGGLFRGSFDRRRELLVAAAAGGVEWLDVEHWEQLSLPPGVRTRILRSYHRMQEAPRDLPAIVERMSRSGADALKVTTMGYDAADVDILNGLYERPGSVPLVAFAAGSACVASRFLALLQGAPFLYCSLGPGQGTAPGQPDLFDALELYHARGLGPESCFWGLLGSPVDHSLGYRLHNGLGRWLRDVPVYLPFDTEQPERLLKNLLSFGPRFLGLSVTAPHKARVLPVMHDLGREASDTRAVNTIIHRDGRILGENTDVEGVRRALRRVFPDQKIPSAVNALVLGGGGAARAACLALLKDGARVCIAPRTKQRIKDFAAHWGIPVLPLSSKTMRLVRPRILVHATSVGSVIEEEDSPAYCLVEQDDILPGSVVLDMVYRPARTVLLDRAERAGAIPLSGLWMFLHQAMLQIEHVLGRSLQVSGVQPLSLLLGPEGRDLRSFARSR